MSDNGQTGQEAMLAMMKAGQAFGQAFMDMIRQQTAAHNESSSGTADHGLPFRLPDNETLAQLQQQFTEQHMALWQNIVSRKPGETGEMVVSPPRSDRRFKAPAWAESPVFDYMRQAYLINAQYLSQLAESAPLADGRAKSRLKYLTRQYIEALAPSNFAATNPEFIQTAIDSRGESITRGIANLLGDLEKGRISMTDESEFEVGRNLATTEGAVIFENQMMQLIQYAPLTEKVGQVPLLIVPPCINKYYIMDLQPANSLVRFIVEQGHTVFLLSWKNPTMAESTMGWHDYVELGPLTALEVVRSVTRVKKPNVLGFCVGGTLLTTALAVAAARGEDPVASLTLMTTLLDFADAGEIGCLVDEASLTAREAAMGAGGLMPGQELANVFSSLRANDLIWQYVVNNYLKGNQPPAFDLLYWNCDSTNLPGPFLTWYLRNLYLENNLRVPGKLRVCDAKIDLGKVKAPAYLMAAREDHIVPWQSAYLARRLLGGDTTFVLGASGHIAGAINPASKNKRSYWINDAVPADPEEWLEQSAEQPGSWWLHWSNWLATHRGKEIAARSKLGNTQHVPIEPAPGRYVKARA